MKIVIAGDFAPRDRVSKLIEQNLFENIVGKVIPIINESDYAIVNLECPIVSGIEKKIIKQGQAFGTNEKTINLLKYSGFDCVTLANNHFRDYGNSGCIYTLNTLCSSGLDIVGGGVNLREAQQCLLKEIAGIKVAFINFCENEFSIADDESSGSAPLDLISNYRQIREAKSRADYVFVIVHGGHEYYSLPSPRMKKTYRWFCDIGADAVINHHQHCYSGYEMHNGKLIFYGLGNFCFDHPKHRRSSWNEGYMVELFTASKNETLNFNLIPFNQCNDEPTIIPMLEKNKDVFLSNINRINEIINDDVQLEERFTDWCKIKTEVYKKALCPFSGVKILERLYNKGLLRWSLPNNKKTLLYNLIFCESHYDVFKEYLKDEYTDIIT